MAPVSKQDNPDQHLRRLATACICNLSADPPLKDSIMRSGAIAHLSRLLTPVEDSRDARAATGTRILPSRGGGHTCDGVRYLCPDRRGLERRPRRHRCELASTFLLPLFFF